MKASIISEIARGIRTEIKGDDKKDIDVGDLFAIAHKGFNMTIPELTAPMYSFDKKPLLHSRVEIEGAWYIMALFRAEK